MVRRPIKDRTEENRELEALKNQVFEQLKRRDQIKETLDRIYTAGNLNPDEISLYLDNPDHFTKNQWAQIQRYRSQIQEFLWQALGPEKKESWQKEEKSRREKRKRQKGVASRRRGWIKMD